MSHQSDQYHDDDKDEIESPVDGPMPDWMKSVSSGSGSKSSFDETQAPSWLQSIRSGRKADPDEGSEESSASATESSSSMSDLERLLAEEGIDLGTVAEERPNEAQGMSARDWLLSTSEDQVVRKKYDDDPVEQAAPQAAAPPPASAADDDADDGLSDLERLLRDEGVDINTVQEERPEGSEGMSTRDWMLHTSDDNVVKKQYDSEPVAGLEAVSEPTPSTAEEDDDDLPDWLRDDGPAAAAPVSTPPADEPDDDLPDWLQDVGDDDETPADDADELDLLAGLDDDDDDDLPDWLTDDGDEQDLSMPAPPASFDDDDDKMVVEDDLPDWLRGDDDISASEPAAEPVAAAADDDDDLPDWLQDVGDDDDDLAAEPVAADDDDDDLPDWLQDVGDDEPVATQASPAPVDADGDDLPDWLKDVADDEAEPLPASAAGDDDALPDWLQEESDDLAADVDSAVEEDDLPDWLQDVQADDEPVVSDAPAPAVVASSAGVEAEDDDDLPDWLREVQEDDDDPVESYDDLPPLEDPQPSASVASEAVSASALDDDDDLPDWLKDVQADDAAPVAALDEGNEDIVDPDGLPDWLQEDDSDFGDDVFEPSEPSPDPFDDMPSVNATPADAEDDDLPDWLQNVQDDAEELELDDVGVSTDDVIAATTMASAVPVDDADVTDDDVVEEEGLPDWLREAEEDNALLDVEDSPAFASAMDDMDDVDDEDMPDWLSNLEDEADDAPLDDAMPEEPTPRPVPDVMPAADPTASSPSPTATDSSEIPDWLEKLRQNNETSDAAPTPTPPQPTPTSPPPPAATPPPPQPTPQPAPQPVAQSASLAGQPAPVATPQVAAPDYSDLPADADQRLKAARSARDAGNIDEAARIYGSLVAGDSHLDRVIEDIQQTVKSYPSNYQLFQLMGDAMMKDGRLQSALEAYRQAMEKL